MTPIWKYKVDLRPMHPKKDYKPEDYETLLSGYGQRGWELVNTILDNNYLYFFMKKKVAETDATFDN
jgi:hypothetical protein